MLLLAEYLTLMVEVVMTGICLPWKTIKNLSTLTHSSVKFFLKETGVNISEELNGLV